MIAPPTIAPGIESSPPRITTGKTRKPTKLMSWLTPTRLATMMPPIAAAAADIAHASANTRLMLIPIDSAACWSSATARIAMPSRV